MHPASNALTRLMILAKNRGIKDVELKVYTKDWDKYFDSNEIDENKILKAFNSEFKTSITNDELKNSKLKLEVADDIKMGEEVLVQGTPTVFINGEKDKSKLKYENLGK